MHCTQKQCVNMCYAIALTQLSLKYSIPSQQCIE